MKKISRVLGLLIALTASFGLGFGAATLISAKTSAPSTVAGCYGCG